MTDRNKIKKAQRIVIKLGTSTLTNDSGGIAIARMYSFVESIIKLKKENKEIIIVSSGAVEIGKTVLENTEKIDPVSLKQACASVGQSQLMHFYREAFDKFNVMPAQILLTAEDFSNRQKYLSLRNTLNTLLDLDVVPIINENDAISANEVECYKEKGIIVCFGDNDKLSALVTSKLDADLLIILSDIDGFYNDDPRKNKNATVFPFIKEITPEIEALGFEASKGGRGGMKTKLEAAKIVTHSGGMVLIVNGHNLEIIDDVFDGKKVGTLFLPVEQLSSKKQWIAYATNVKSFIKVNDGAKTALVDNKASLMPVGIIEVKNSFKKGDVVSILDKDGQEFARGMTNYESRKCRRVIGKHSDEIEKIIGFKNYDTVIARDNIVIL